jgi:uncharacterized coiled-coil DUF342 family protein
MSAAAKVINSQISVLEGARNELEAQAAPLRAELAQVRAEVEQGQAKVRELKKRLVPILNESGDLFNAIMALKKPQMSFKELQELNAKRRAG